MNEPDPLPALSSHELRERRCRRRIGAALMTLNGLYGCAASHGAAPVASNTVRVIVRFAPHVKDAGDPAFLVTLAAAARVAHIEVIRPMSGDAYVMRITCDDRARRPTADGCDAAIERVRVAGPVVWIEADGRESTR